MVAIPDQVETFLFSPSCPQVLRDWILQDLGWKPQDISEIKVEFQNLEARYWKYGSLAIVSVKRNDVRNIECQQFLCLPNGNWQRHKGFIQSGDTVIPVTDWQIEYTSKYATTVNTNASSCETVVKKQELSDDDAFDLMDSIRKDNIFYGNHS